MASIILGVAVAGLALRAPAPSMSAASMKDTRSFISSLLVTAESTSPYWPAPKDWQAQTAATRQYIVKMNNQVSPTAAVAPMPLSPSGKSPAVQAPAVAPAEATVLAALHRECEISMLERARKAKLCEMRLEGLKAIRTREQWTELLLLRDPPDQPTASLTGVAVPSRAGRAAAAQKAKGTILAPEGFEWAEATF